MKEVISAPFITYRPPNSDDSQERSNVKSAKFLLSNTAFDPNTSEAVQKKPGQMNSTLNTCTRFLLEPTEQCELNPVLLQISNQCNPEKFTGEHINTRSDKEATGSQNMLRMTLGEKMDGVKKLPGQKECHELYLQSSDDETVISDSGIEEEIPGGLVHPLKTFIE